MRELKQNEIMQVSGAGMIADHLQQVGSQIGGRLDKFFKTDTNTNAAQSIGHDIGTVIETNVTNFVNLTVGSLNKFLKWMNGTA